jgi:DNA-binding YbaB/EbfC family protein
MARRKGGPGGFGGPQGLNQGAIMKQIQKMQDDMAAAQEALGEEKIEVSVGGGAVTVVVNGHSEVQAITIDPDIIDTEDDEWLTDLQDLLLAAMNQALEQSKALSEERMSGFTGGLESMLPPGLGGLLG